jgi:HSP20 family protein
MLTLFKDPFYSVFDTVLDTQINKIPQVNIRKNENEYKLIMSVPGLTKDDIKITTKEGLITISYNKEEKNERTYFVSSFEKSYSLPTDVVEKNIEGKVENGVLELILPLERKKPLERLISLN